VMTRVCALAAVGSSISSAVPVTANRKRGRRTYPPYTNGAIEMTKWTGGESRLDLPLSSRLRSRWRADSRGY